MFILRHKKNMAQINIAEFQLPNWQYAGQTATLRLYPSKTFTTPENEIILKGSVTRSAFYKEIVCTVAGDTLTIPATSLDATTDTDTPTVTYQAILYDADNVRRETFHKKLRVPHTIKNSNWIALKTYSDAAVIANAPNTYVTTDQINGMLAGLYSAAVLATDSVYGIGRADVAHESAADPVFVSPKSPLVAKATSTSAGRVRLDTAPADAADPVAVGVNSQLFQQIVQNTANATEATKGVSLLSKAPADPQAPQAVGANEAVFAEGKKDFFLTDYANNIGNALTAIGTTNNRTLRVTDSFTYSGSPVTIPANITVKIDSGRVITAANGSTVQIDKLAGHASRQLFSGDVVLGRGATDEIKILWFHSPANGTDISLALAQAKKSADKNVGATLSLPSGVFQTEALPNFPSATILKGQGSNWHITAEANGQLTHGTVLQPKSGNDYFLKVGGSQAGIRLKDIHLDGTLLKTGQGVRQGKGVLFEAAYADGYALDFFFDNVYFSNFAKAFSYVSLAGAADWQVEQIVLTRCKFHNNDVGFHINSQNNSITLFCPTFFIPQNGTGILIEGGGTINIYSNYEAASNTRPSGATFLRRTGNTGGTVNIYGSQGEQCDNFFVNDASVPNPINVFAGSIQSKIILNQSCRLNIFGAVMYHHNIVNGANSASEIHLNGCHFAPSVPGYTFDIDGVRQVELIRARFVDIRQGNGCKLFIDGERAQHDGAARYKGAVDVGSLRLGTLGSELASLTKGQVLADLPLVAQGGWNVAQITLPGAAVGDAIELYPPAGAFPVGVNFICPYVSAADTVTVTIDNRTGAAFDLAPTLFDFVLKKSAPLTNWLRNQPLTLTEGQPSSGAKFTQETTVNGYRDTNGKWANNGNDPTSGGGYQSAAGCASDGSIAITLSYTLEKPCPVREINVFGLRDNVNDTTPITLATTASLYVLEDAKFFTSADGITYTERKSFVGNDKVWLQYQTALPELIRGFRLEITKCAAGVAGTSNGTPQVVEVELRG